MQKGQKHTKTTKDKMRAAALERDNTKRLASLPKGKTHWRWSSKASLSALHKRLKTKFGKASNYPCVDCGKPAKDWSNEEGNYTDILSDYRPRCRKCHILKDESWIKRNLTIKAKKNG